MVVLADKRCLLGGELIAVDAVGWLRAFAGWRWVFGGVAVEAGVAEVDVASVAFDFDGELMIFSVRGEVLYLF